MINEQNEGEETGLTRPQFAVRSRSSRGYFLNKRIRERAVPEGSTAMRIAVENTGIVITPVDVEKLFITFRQRREEVERLIGATLQVKSAMGTGSIILLTFAGYDHARAGVAQAWRRARLICTC